MKATATKEFDLFLLFVHDHYMDCEPLSSLAIEQSVNEQLELLGYDDYQVCCPDGLRSRDIQDASGDRITKGRSYTVEDVKTAIGVESSELLKHLEEINAGSFTIK